MWQIKNNIFPKKKIEPKYCVKSARIWAEYGEILCTLYLSVFSPNAGKYGAENSEYGHFSRSNYFNHYQKGQLRSSTKYIAKA